MKDNKTINDILDVLTDITDKTRKLESAFNFHLTDYNDDVFDKLFAILTDLFGSKCPDCREVMSDALFLFQDKEIDKTRLFLLINEALEEQEEELNYVEREEVLG